MLNVVREALIEWWNEGNAAYYGGQSEDMCPYKAGEFDLSYQRAKRNAWVDGFYGRNKP